MPPDEMNASRRCGSRATSRTAPFTSTHCPKNCPAARAEAEKARRLRIKQEAPVAPINELEDRRGQRIVAYLEQHPGPQSIGQLVGGLKRAKAFEDLTNRSRRNAILRLVRGKLRELLIVTIGAARNRKPTIFVELRR